MCRQPRVPNGTPAGRPGASPEWVWDNPQEAAREFAASDSRFLLEEPPLLFNEACVDQRITYWPSAYLRRVA